MEALLTPSESLAFQSFLSSVDEPQRQPPADWASYASQFNHALHRKDNNDALLASLPSPRENDLLTKATKDLMSLDDGLWGGDGMVLDQPQSQHHQYYNHLGQLLPHPNSPPIQSPQPSTYAPAHDSFPFKPQLQHPDPYPQPRYHENHSPQFPYTTPNYHHGAHLDHSSGNGILYNGSQSSESSQQHQQPHTSHLAHTRVQSLTPTSTVPPKRPTLAPSIARARSSSSPSTAGPSTNKRTTAAEGRSSPSQLSHPSNTTQSHKPALLSPSQKKANHIQSEQKRRANIRRGYEALCETVPALREAIREEEEEAQAAALAAAAGMSNSKGRSAKKRNGKKKEGDESARDKFDGRAGPRSENVVLSKTIDYINDLLSDKASLHGRLQRARSMLPPGHPALVPISPNPAWEREWKGGEGKEGNEEDGEDSEDAEGEDMDEGDEAASKPSTKMTRKKGKESD